MAYEQKPDSGSLFKNKDKQSEKHADYKGDALIGGVAYFIDAWINESKKTGEKFMAIRFKAKQKQAAQRGGEQPDDFIP